MEQGVEFYLYGPDYQGRFQRLADLIKTEEVDKLMYLSQPIVGEEKEKELLSADCFIQTSRTEGMPTGILEALSYGVPCLVTEGTTLAEKINEENAGWGCETSVQGISNALQAFVNGKDGLQEKSRNAQALIEKEFCWEKVAADTIKIYENLLK